MKYWFIVENMYFYCTYSIKTKILLTLGTGYFLKITKINSQLEKPIVLIAKISSRKTQKIANCWFSHDVTKIQTTKLSILVRFYFHEVLGQLETNCHTNFRFKRVLGFVTESTLEFLSYCVTWHLHDGREGCHVGWKSDVFRRILLSKQFMY